jgi:hypothetical protein
MIRKISHYIIFLSFITYNITSCVDLSGTSRTSEKKAVYGHAKAPTKNRVKNQKHPSYRGEVHTMRGGLGIFSIGMNQLRDACAEQFNIPSSSIMWYDAGEVSHSIIRYQQTHKEHRPIILIGHSLGANEQIKVARALNKKGVSVDLLVTIDAVSQTIVPPNVKYALNVYKPGFVPMFSGLRLRAVNPETTFINNVNVDEMKGMQENHFTVDKNPVVQALVLKQIEKVLRDAQKKTA